MCSCVYKHPKLDKKVNKKKVTSYRLQEKKELGTRNWELENDTRCMISVIRNY